MSSIKFFIALASVMAIILVLLTITTSVVVATISAVKFFETKPLSETIWDPEELDPLEIVYGKNSADFSELNFSFSTEGKCAVCQSTFMANSVVCDDCQSPHCIDCWHYWGKCSIYGCRGTRYQDAEALIGQSA